MKNAPLYSAKFLVAGYTSILAPLVPVLLSDMKLSLMQAGALISCFSLFNSLLQPLFGWAQARMGYVHSLCLAPLWVGLFMGLTGVAPNFGVLTACVVLAGIGIAAFHPASFAALAEGGDPSAASMRISFLLVSASLGFVLGPSFIGFFVSRLGMEKLYLIAFPGLPATLLLYCSFRRNRKSAARSPEQSCPLTDVLSRIAPFFVFALTLTIAAMNLYSFVPILLKQQGAPPEMIGISMSAFALGCTLGPLGGSLIARRFGRRSLLFASAVFSIVFLAVFTQAQTAPVNAAIDLFLLGAALMLPSSVLIEMAQEAFPEHLAAVSSLLTGFAWGCGGVLVILFAGIAEAVGVEKLIGGLILLPFINLALTFRARPFRSRDEDSSSLAANL